MANLDIDLDFDFGFTTSSEEEIKQEGTDKAKHMYDAIMPLLTNLKKDADKNNNKKSIKHLIPKRIRQISMKNG